MSEYKIEKGIPLPERQNEEKHPFGEMEVGDSVFIPNGDKEILSRVIYWSKTMGRKFSIGDAEKDGVRVWRIA